MMNRIKLSLLGFFLAITASGQLKLDKVYDYSLTVTKINATEYKYYLMDVSASQCRIYNPDHSLWKTIPVSLPSGYYLYDIKFVSQNLFNSDALIELWYSAYEWISTGTSTGYYRYLSKVISENGTELASVTGGAYAYVVQTSASDFKLEVYAYDNSVTPYTIKTYLYSLPNPSSAVNFVSLIPGDPYPNPAREIINLPLTGDGKKGTLQVFSVSGQKMTEAEVSGERYYPLQTRNWTAGIYTYRIIRNGQSSEVKQFVVR